MNISLQERMTGSGIVKALGSPDYEQLRFGETAASVAANFVLAGRLAVTRDAILKLLYAALTAGIVLIGGWQVEQGWLTVGTLTAVALLVVQLAGTTTDFEWRVRLFSRAAAAGGRMFEVLDTRNPIVVAANARDLSATGHVVFDSVSFAYTDGVPALHDVLVRATARAVGRDRRRLRIRQEHHRAPAAPFLRRIGGAHHHRRL